MPLRPISMALTNADKQREARPFDERPVEEVPDFPGGLTLYLTSAELRKLGMNSNSAALESGDLVRLVGTAMVTSARTERVNTINEHSATLQIQELGLERVTEEEDTTRANALYGAPNAS